MFNCLDCNSFFEKLLIKDVDGYEHEVCPDCGSYQVKAIDPSEVEDLKREAREERRLSVLLGK